MDVVNEIEITSAEQLREWLSVHHSRRESVWLVTYKKHVSSQYVPFGDLVDEALCFGWVDSKVQRVDADRVRRFLSPRRAGSAWSRVNKEKIARLEAAGRMASAGRAVVERAREDGSWTWLDEIEDLVVPPDLAEVLAAEPRLRFEWEAWPASLQKGVLRELKSAKTDATRRRRLEKCLQRARDGKRPL